MHTFLQRILTLLHEQIVESSADKLLKDLAETGNFAHLCHLESHAILRKEENLGIKNRPASGKRIEKEEEGKGGGAVEAGNKYVCEES